MSFPQSILEYFKNQFKEYHHHRQYQELLRLLLFTTLQIVQFKTFLHEDSLFSLTLPLVFCKTRHPYLYFSIECLSILTCPLRYQSPFTSLQLFFQGLRLNLHSLLFAFQFYSLYERVASFDLSFFEFPPPFIWSLSKTLIAGSLMPQSSLLPVLFHRTFYLQNRQVMCFSLKAR